jgi:outer membrane biosynthesis protein TonB
MKRLLLRPQVILVGIAGLALFGWGAAGAVSAASAGHHVTLHEVSTQVEREAQTPEAPPTAEPEVEDQAPAAAPPPVNEPPEAQEEQNEAPEPAENENEAAPDENPAPPTAAPTPAPTTSSMTFTLTGGTVTFMCTNNQISIASAVPAAGFTVESETEDGGQQAKVRFESDTHRSEIEATCVGGHVQATEMREESE